MSYLLRDLTLGPCYHISLSLSLSLSLSVYLSLCICVCVCYNERQSEEMYFSFIEVLQHDASAAGIGILLYPAAIAS